MRAFVLLLLFPALLLAQEEEGAAGEEEAAEGGLDALGGGLDWKAKPIDFKKVDRTIRKLPALNKPIYGLFLFGVDGKKRVWAVLDARGKGAEEYDVLHLDRNADGDLTGKGERIEGKDGKFAIGNFAEPGTEVVHEDFEIAWTKEDVRFRMKWAGESATMGGCAFAPSPKEAPIFVPGTERPFDFAWAGGTLKRGQENDFKVRIGNRGDRDGAFSSVDETFLPEGEKVLVQLVCRDAAGTERKLTADLKDRSPGGLYHGPVKIPKDAAPGSATLRVRLPDSSAFESFTTEIPVTID